MSDKAVVLNKIGSIILEAEMSVKDTRPDSRRIPNIYRKIYWDEAPQELKDNPNINWYYNKGAIFENRKYTFYKPTEEQQKEKFFDRQWKLREMFYYILYEYGINEAIEFLNIKEQELKEYQVKIKTTLAFCKYNETGQCSLFCPFYSKGKCLNLEGE